MEQTPLDSEDYIGAARFALQQVQKGRVWFGEAAECLDPILNAMKSLDRLAGLDNVRRANRHWSEKLGPWPEKRPHAITIRDEGDIRFICDYDGTRLLGYRMTHYPETSAETHPITAAYLALDHSLDGFGH